MANHHPRSGLGGGGGDNNDRQADDRLYDSDDSGFYGNEQTKDDCAAEVASFNILDYWAVHQDNFKAIITQELWRRRNTQQIPISGAPLRLKRTSSQSPGRLQQGKQGSKKIKIESATSLDSEDERHSGTTATATTTIMPTDCSTVRLGKDEQALFIPFKDNPMAYQMYESMEDFLARLPPSRTTLESGPWIWMANPRTRRRPAAEDIAGFKNAGSRLLWSYLDKKQRYKQALGAENTLVLKNRLKPDRDRLQAEIIALAKAKNVTVGKWMLFVTTDQVDSIWRLVAKATLDGLLGCECKVATGRNGDNIPGRERLICVYTENFNHPADLERVLLQMKNLGLPVHGRDGRGIYYKCDAYTHLDIVSGNDYDLQASMYSSRDFDSNSRRRW